MPGWCRNANRMPAATAVPRARPAPKTQKKNRSAVVLGRAQTASNCGMLSAAHNSVNASLPWLGGDALCGRSDMCSTAVLHLQMLGPTHVSARSISRADDYRCSDTED